MEQAALLIDVEDVALGHEAKMRWNEREKWIFSDNIVHTPLIDAETSTATPCGSVTRWPAARSHPAGGVHDPMQLDP